MTGIAVTTADTGNSATTAAAATGATTDTQATTGNGNTSATTTETGISVGSSDTPVKTGANDPWHASLQDAGVKDWASKKNWATSEDAHKSHLALEQAYSGKLEALAPKTAAEYQFTKPANVPAEVYNDTFATGFKTWAHAQKLSNEQAAGLHDAFVKYASESLGVQSQEMQRQQGEAIVSAERTLKADWGATDNPVFTRNMEMARRTMVQAGMSVEDMRAAGILTNVGGKDVVTNAKMFQFFAKAGSAMYAEDSTFGKGPTSADNPFSSATMNLKSQGEIFKSDPQRAAMLIDSLPPAERGMHSATRAQLKAKGF